MEQFYEAKSMNLNWPETLLEENSIHNSFGAYNYLIGNLKYLGTLLLLLLLNVAVTTAMGPAYFITPDVHYCSYLYSDYPNFI